MLAQPETPLPTSVRRATTPDDLGQVLRLPHHLHANDPAWVPPIGILERRRLRSGNPALEEGGLVLLLAERDGRTVGSISVLRDRAFERHKGERVAWFGYFEAIDDQEVVDALFAAAAEVARGWGAEVLRGPRNLSRWEYVGLTVEGYHRTPPMLQGHHPPWYRARIEAAGLVKHHDVLAYEAALVDALGEPRPLPEGLMRKARDCDLPKLEVRCARRRTLGADLRATHRVLNAAYSTVPDVAPIPLRTFVSIGRAYLSIANMELLQLAFVDGEPAGFAVCLPEVNEALAFAQGELLPLGWLRFALGLRQVRTAAFKLVGVLPEHRGSGLHAVLIQHVVEGAQRAGYTRLDGSVIDERNGPMRAVVEGAGMTVWRRYRFYELPV